MRVLIIGGSGQLGQDLMKLFAAEAVALEQTQVDVTDGASLLHYFQEIKPDWVINTAAFHKVQDCEVNPQLSFAVNSLGAQNAARCAALVNAGIVFISTDYVYGGGSRQPGHPYDETVPPYPLNVYGVSKAAGEWLVQLANAKHIIVRSAGLFGLTTSGKGWTFPELMYHKGKTDGKVRVVSDQVLSPTFTPDLAAQIRNLILADARGLFHATNSEECSWFDLAKEVFTITGLQVQMQEISSAETGATVRRPSYSALVSKNVHKYGIPCMRPWREALRIYLQEKGFI